MSFKISSFFFLFDSWVEREFPFSDEKVSRLTTAEESPLSLAVAVLEISFSIDPGSSPVDTLCSHVGFFDVSVFLAASPLLYPTQDKIFSCGTDSVAVSLLSVESLVVLPAAVFYGSLFFSSPGLANFLGFPFLAFLPTGLPDVGVWSKVVGVLSTNDPSSDLFPALV